MTCPSSPANFAHLCTVQKGGLRLLGAAAAAGPHSSAGGCLRSMLGRLLLSVLFADLQTKQFGAILHTGRQVAGQFRRPAASTTQQT